MVDIPVCEKGDEILIRPEKNVILQNYGIPYDKAYPDSQINPECMDIRMLQDNMEFRRFRSKKEPGNEDYGFIWQGIDDDIVVPSFKTLVMILMMMITTVSILIMILIRLRCL
jgi:hypothetical protein